MRPSASGQAEFERLADSDAVRYLRCRNEDLRELCCHCGVSAGGKFPRTPMCRYLFATCASLSFLTVFSLALRALNFPTIEFTKANVVRNILNDLIQCPTANFS